MWRTKFTTWDFWALSVVYAKSAMLNSQVNDSKRPNVIDVNDVIGTGKNADANGFKSCNNLFVPSFYTLKLKRIFKITRWFKTWFFSPPIFKILLLDVYVHDEDQDSPIRSNQHSCPNWKMKYFRVIGYIIYLTYLNEELFEPQFYSGKKSIKAVADLYNTNLQNFICRIRVRVRILPPWPISNKKNTLTLTFFSTNALVPIMLKYFKHVKPFLCG